MNQTIIALSQRVDIIESYGETRDSLDQEWTNFLLEMHCVPLILPNHPEASKVLLEKVKPQGIVLTGGSGPVIYGGNSQKRDDTDELLLSYAMEENIPLLGVCRGMQSIACYFHSALEELSGHIATKHPMVGKIEREVNSFHGWGIPSIAEEEFHVLARSEDGFIECIRHKTHQIMGMMWHPERNSPFEQEDIQLIQTFLQETRNDT